MKKKWPIIVKTFHEWDVGKKYLHGEYRAETKIYENGSSETIETGPGGWHKDSSESCQNHHLKVAYVIIAHCGFSEHVENSLKDLIVGNVVKEIMTDKTSKYHVMVMEYIKDMIFEASRGL